MKVHNKIFKATGVLLVAAVLFAVIPVGNALAQTTISVCPGGSCNYTSIQAAIDAANPGDTIEVADGTYDITSEGAAPGQQGLINIDTPVTVKSQDDGNPTRPIIDATGVDGVFKIHHSNMSGGQVVIKGFDITGDPSVGIAITSAMCGITGSPGAATEVIIQDNLIHGMVGGIDAWGTGFCNAGEGEEPRVENIKIVGNQFYNLGVPTVQQGFGILLESLSSWAEAGDTFAAVVEDNAFYDIENKDSSNLGAGIALEMPTTTSPRPGNAKIEGNSFWDSAPGMNIGIFAGDVVDTVIFGNNFDNSATYDVFNTVAGTVNASGNWWGAASGPSAGSLYGDVDYTPWLAAGDPGMTYSDIFEGDFSTLWVDDDSLQTGTTGRIQEGVDMVSGSTVNVAAGTYSEVNILIDKSLILIGDPGDVNSGPGVDAPIIDGGGSYGDAFKIANGVSNVTIKGFEVWNYTTDDFNGVGNAISAWVGSTSNITVQDNYFHNLGYNGILVGNDYNSDPNKWGDHTGWTVKSNIIEDFGYIGFELTNTSTSTIENNIIHLSTPYIGAIFSSARRNETGLTIKDNLIDGTPSAAYPVIYIYAYDLDMADPNLDNLLIEGNTIATSGTPFQIYIRNIGSGTVTNVKVEENNLSTLKNATVQTIDASPNYWGSSCGPSSGAVEGDVVYSPWYVDEAKTQISDGTTYVFPMGASIETMNAIIACAAPGSTLTFEGGTYPGGLVVDNNGLTFDLNGGTVGPGSPAFTVNGDNFTINGPGTLDGGGSSDHAIVVADGVSNFTLNNAEILNWANGVHYAGEIINTQIVDNFIHDLTGDAVHFTQQPTAQTSVSFYIQGNLFKHNDGVGVNNAGATEINAEYNSWSDFAGPTGPDGDGSTNADTDPFTHVDLYMVSTNPDVDNWPNQVFVDDTITYQVKAHVVNLTTGSFDFSYPTDLLGSPTIANVNTNFSPVPTYTDVVTVNETTGVISFDGQTGTTTLTPLSGDIVLFEVTFTGLLPGEATLDFNEDTDEFGMSPGSGPSVNIYADELVNSSLKVITRPVLTPTGLEGPYVAGLSHEISMETCNAATGGDWSESVEAPIEPDTIGWIRITDITLDKIASLQFLWEGDWYDFSVQDAYGGNAVQQDVDDVIARFGNYNFGLEIINDWCDVDGFRVTFVEPGTHDVTVEIYDMMDTAQDDIGGDDILLASYGPTSITVDGNFDVTGTISMQGRTVRTGVPLTLTDVDGDPIYGPHNSTSTSELAFNVLFTGVNGSIYEITTDQPRYLNITADLDKQFLVDGAYMISALELKGGNANWDVDNVVDISDASIVGGQYGTGTIADDGDVNFDDRVNIQDLAIVGGNYGLDGTTAYASWLTP